MSKQNTRATIDANIKQNGQQQITGEILNSVLNAMVTDYAEQEKLTELEREVDEVGTKTDNSFCDLAFGDEEGNDIVRFSDGGVRTKGFDSRNTPSIEGEEDCDLAFVDENGKAIAKFVDGGIKTANFDSRILSPKLYGKKLAIIGDSISTYAGFIPSGYVTNYPSGDVDNVNKCYWKIAADRLGMSVNNCAYSGSMASGMSSGDSDNGFAACGDNRIANLGRDGFDPDIVLAYIGINDFNGTSRTLGTWDGTQTIPTDGFITAFTNAYALMISKIQTTYPNARVFCATLMPDNYNDTDGYPSTNSRGEALCLWNDAIRKIANALGCDIVEMAACGINYPNAAENTIEGLHPNAKGMQKMANKLIAELIAKY